MGKENLTKSVMDLENTDQSEDTSESASSLADSESGSAT